VDAATGKVKRFAPTATPPDLTEDIEAVLA
jgi:glutathione peroxidase-family protein